MVCTNEPVLMLTLFFYRTLPALSLAMRRDGSSGGTIRLAVITENGVERHFVPGDKLPMLASRDV